MKAIRDIGTGALMGVALVCVSVGGWAIVAILAGRLPGVCP